jgi:hypothetical protein
MGDSYKCELLSPEDSGLYKSPKAWSIGEPDFVRLRDKAVRIGIAPFFDITTFRIAV